MCKTWFGPPNHCFRKMCFRETKRFFCISHLIGQDRHGAFVKPRLVRTRRPLSAVIKRAPHALREAPPQVHWPDLGNQPKGSLFLPTLHFVLGRYSCAIGQNRKPLPSQAGYKSTQVSALLPSPIITLPYFRKLPYNYGDRIYSYLVLLSFT